MAKRKILLIAEGQKKEVELFNKLFAEFELDLDHEIFPYRTNIYDLYERIFPNDEPEDLSLLGVLREMADDADKPLFDYDYSDVLLVFDYDPQDDRFSPSRIELLQEFFSESTNEGKLYINYPMVEACKHFLAMPDYDYLKRVIAAEDIPNYKEIVGNSTSFPSLTCNVSKYELSLMVALVAAKACFITNAEVDLRAVAELYYDVDFTDILKKQNRSLNSERMVSVLGTSLLFLADYSSELSNLSWAIKTLYGR